MTDIILLTLFVLAPWFAIAFSVVCLYYLFRVSAVLEEQINVIKAETIRKRDILTSLAKKEER